MRTKKEVQDKITEILREPESQIPGLLNVVSVSLLLDIRELLLEQARELLLEQAKAKK